MTHSLPPQKREIFESLDAWAADNVLVLLKPVESSWQPQDYLPDASSSSEESFHDEVAELRARAREIPDDYWVCLVGDMVTEEALPTYQTMLNTLDGGVRFPAPGSDQVFGPLLPKILSGSPYAVDEAPAVANAWGCDRGGQWNNRSVLDSEIDVFITAYLRQRGAVG